jgi:hypothetical protein
MVWLTEHSLALPFYLFNKAILNTMGADHESEEEPSATNLSDTNACLVPTQINRQPIN